MMRVVLDANVLISSASALERPASTLGRLLIAQNAMRFRLVTSHVILSEVKQNLSRVPALAHYSEMDVEQYLEYLLDMAEIIEVTDVIAGAATHHEDDWILATAVLGEVEFLVTGDKQLLALKTYRGVTIVTPRYFVEQCLNE